jgi:predicted transcriptional regulator
MLIFSVKNKLIVDLYFKDGKTEQQIADLMGLTQRAISEIITNRKSSITDINVGKADKRRKLTDNFSRG